jgi:hypothetical protein
MTNIFNAEAKFRSNLHNLYHISQNLDNIAMAQLGAFAVFGLSVQLHNSIFDKLVGLRPTLADT